MRTKKRKGKLKIELVPSPLWKLNLRSHLSRKEWDRLRKECYLRAEYKCETCHGVGRKHPVECHEIWHYNDEEKIQTLKGVIALCPPCHRAKHLGHTLKVGGWMAKRTIEHLQKVNNLSDDELTKYLRVVFNEWALRSKYNWRQDLSEFESWWAEQ